MMSCGLKQFFSELNLQQGDSSVSLEITVDNALTHGLSRPQFCNGDDFFPTAPPSGLLHESWVDFSSSSFASPKKYHQKRCGGSPHTPTKVRYFLEPSGLRRAPCPKQSKKESRWETRTSERNLVTPCRFLSPVPIVPQSQNHGKRSKGGKGRNSLFEKLTDKAGGACSTRKDNGIARETMLDKALDMLAVSD